MARILMTWELGGGLGHVSRLRNLASELVHLGHEVILALRDLSACGQMFDGMDVGLLQAPFKGSAPSKPFLRPATFPHILHNCGFADPREMSGRVWAWKTLFREIEPDLILFDHSPTALVAARSTNVRKVLIGTGFCCPPAAYPLPNMRHWSRPNPGQLKSDEDRVTHVINHALLCDGDDPIEQISDLYRDVDENLLMSFEELDHFGPRKNVKYWGTWPGPGSKPQWSDSPQQKVFAYLKPGDTTEMVLTALARRQLSTVAYVPGLPKEILKKFTSDLFRFATSPVDLQQAGEQCDLAITHGTHGVTTAMLMAGRPVLMLPITVEQHLYAERVEEMGAGLLVGRGRIDPFYKQFDRILEDPILASEAQAFASRYSNVDPWDQFTEIVARIIDLLPTVNTHRRTIGSLLEMGQDMN